MMSVFSTRAHPNKKSAENEAAEVAFTALELREKEELAKRSVGEAEVSRPCILTTALHSIARQST